MRLFSRVRRGQRHFLSIVYRRSLLFHQPGLRRHARDLWPFPRGSQFLQWRKTLSSLSTNEISEDVVSHTSTFPSATCTIKDLEDAVVGTNVVVHGYVGPRSDISKDLSFVTLFSDNLADKIQIVSSAQSEFIEAAKQHARLKALRLHTPVAVRGFVKEKKPRKNKSFTSPSCSRREILLESIQPLNSVAEDIVIKGETNFPPEQRYLQIRTDTQLRNRLLFRANIANGCRNILQNEHSFVEVDTPILFKSTAEGAREFLVPTRAKGMAYALPQSPQQYKQILMASGIPKYFQLARCFRDEDHRADRQPEFTQLDIEMAFAKDKDVMILLEDLIRRLWSKFLGIDMEQIPFDRLSYESAMRLYGSDKPDRRIGMEITQLSNTDSASLPEELVKKLSSLRSPTIEGFKIHLSCSANESKEFINRFMNTHAAVSYLRNPDGQPGIFFYDHAAVLEGLSSFGFEYAETVKEKFNLEHGDILVIQARKTEDYSSGSTSLGNLRLALHKAAVAENFAFPSSGFDFLWITDFPLFTKIIDTKGMQGKEYTGDTFVSTHHPFTAPSNLSDLERYAHDPTKIRALHYDLVVNGVELGGGSQRIHVAHAQKFVLESLLRLDARRVQEFDHLLDALSAGCPPHAGIALGFDRLLAVMTGVESVRDVIAFPKNGNKGEDMMVKSPSKITEEQLATYHLKVGD